LHYGPAWLECGLDLVLENSNANPLRLRCVLQRRSRPSDGLRIEDRVLRVVRELLAQYRCCRLRHSWLLRKARRFDLRDWSLLTFVGMRSGFRGPLLWCCSRICPSLRLRVLNAVFIPVYGCGCSACGIEFELPFEST
jgi:hypothetical protein